MSQQIVLVNQFGEESINQVQEAGTTAPALGDIAATSMVANLTGAAAPAIAVTTQAVANKLPAKAGVAAIVPLTGTETLSQVITYINTLLAALKVSS